MNKESNALSVLKDDPELAGRHVSVLHEIKNYGEKEGESWFVILTGADTSAITGESKSSLQDAIAQAKGELKREQEQKMVRADKVKSAMFRISEEFDYALEPLSSFSGILASIPPNGGEVVSGDTGSVLEALVNECSRRVHGLIEKEAEKLSLECQAASEDVDK